MPLFFKTIDQINQFTLSLELNQGQVICANCKQCDQFVSHGFVYKNLNHGKTMLVGKRLFCANRRQRSGCGRTLRLYLAEQIPMLVYSTLQMTIFLKALLACNTIQNAYEAATGTNDPRNAYRWLNKLKSKLIDYCTFLKKPRELFISIHQFSTRRLQLLLPIIKNIFFTIDDQPCQNYQIQTYKPFI